MVLFKPSMQAMQYGNKWELFETKRKYWWEEQWEIYIYQRGWQRRRRDRRCLGGGGGCGFLLCEVSASEAPLAAGVESPSAPRSSAAPEPTPKRFALCLILYLPFFSSSFPCSLFSHSTLSQMMMTLHKAIKITILIYQHEYYSTANDLELVFLRFNMVEL